MSTHTNRTLRTITDTGWDEGAIRVAVFTGEPAYVEEFPVCLEFPDNEPCLSSTVARRLATLLLEAADLADKAAQSGGTT